MKKIEAIIRKTKFEDVKEALLSSDIDWFEYHDVHGIGQSRQERIYRGVQYSTDVIERVAHLCKRHDRHMEHPYRRTWRHGIEGQEIKYKDNKNT